MDEDTVEDGVEGVVEGAAEEAAGPAQDADHDLVMATAARIIASDAAIIHRLGTV